MSDEHQQVADAYNSVDPNAEYQEKPVETTPEEVVSTPSGVGAGHQVASSEEPAAEPEITEYAPNYKYTVRGEEREFDEWARGFVKDKDTEDNLRRLMEKAHGLDFVEESRERYKSQLEEIQPRLQTYEEAVQKMAHFREKGNLDGVFKVLGITEQEVMDYTQRRLQYHEMSPEQKMAYDQQIQQQQMTYEQQQQMQFWQQRAQESMVAAKENEVRLVMSRPEISDFAAQFDQRMGREGAFREEVWNRGQYHAMVNKTDIGAEQAINEVLQLVGAGNLLTQNQQNTYQTQVAQQKGPMSTPASHPQPRHAPPTIPKVQASGASPTQFVPKSLDEIRAYRREKFGS